MAPRGRGRGRGGAGSSRGRGGARGGRRRIIRRNYGTQRSQESQKSSTFDVENFDIEKSDVQQLFIDSQVPMEAHVKAQEQNKWRYLAVMATLTNNGVDILMVSKVRALAAAWARHDHELANALMAREEDIGVVEILKALSSLDAGRRGRAEEKRLAKLKHCFTQAGKKGKTRLGRRMVEVKKNINNYNKDKSSIGSASGALSRHIKKWTRGIPAEKLQFFALHLPTETWKQLADVVHLNPEKDFPNAPWFLKYCFDQSAAPEGSLVKECNGLDAENVNEYLKTVDVPFSHVKQFADKLTEESKTRIARFTGDVDSLLWNYEDLRCAGVDTVICERLNAGETVNLPYGKLMERLLVIRKLRKVQSDQNQPTRGRGRNRGGNTSQNHEPQAKEVAPFYPKLLPLAETMLKSIKITVESPVVVIGDASASMDVAIETSTIIASFLRALTNAKLVFFSGQLIEPKFIPDTIEDVLELAMVTKTVGNTCHASALWPFYAKKEIVKTFIICTDEEENADWNGEGENYRFQSLFEKYCKEVYPAKLVFVSFLHHQHAKGQMVEPLKAAGFDVIQFKLDHNRPDLNKLDNLVGQLSMESIDFDQQVTSLTETLKEKGMQSAFDKLTVQMEH